MPRRSTTRPGTPAIARKLDPTLPGVDETLDEFATITLPRFQQGYPSQHLTMTLLGEYWAGRTEALPSAALVELLGALEVNPAGARAALGRLTSRGALIMHRQGRTTWYRASPHLISLLAQGRAITAGFGPPRSGWDGTWSFLHWSLPGPDPGAGHRLRQHLRHHGYAPLLPGTWVAPERPGETLATTLATAAGLRFTLVTGRAEAVPGALDPLSAWDREEMRPVYDEFLATFGPVDPPALGPAEALAVRSRAVYRWFVIASIDPDLPAELLPADWPRARARALFAALTDALAPAATAHVRAVVAGHDQARGELVALPSAYRS